MIINSWNDNYPTWVCRECGLEASKNTGNKPLAFQLSTYHDGVCGVCGKEKSVTEPRDFWYPDFNINLDRDI